MDGLTGSCRPSLPVAGGHFGKFTHIVGHHYRPFAAGMGSNVQDIHTNGLAELFSPGADGAIVLRCLAAVGEHFEPAAKIFDDRQVFADLAAFFSTVKKLRQGDRRNRHAAGVLVKNGQRLLGAALQEKIGVGSKNIA